MRLEHRSIVDNVYNDLYTQVFNQCMISIDKYAFDDTNIKTYVTMGFISTLNNIKDISTDGIQAAEF